MIIISMVRIRKKIHSALELHVHSRSYPSQCQGKLANRKQTTLVKYTIFVDKLTG